MAASRAVIFCQIVDDPSSIPEKFPTVDDQQKERQILFSLIIDLVKWENLNNTTLIERARGKIKESWQRCCIDNKNHPEASIIFNPKKLPKFYDPFAGGGSIPLEAHRLGLEAYANDLNPVAVLINKAMIEIPFKFIGNSPINPSFKNNLFIDNPFRNNALCLAEDLDYYGKLLKE